MRVVEKNIKIDKAVPEFDSQDVHLGEDGHQEVHLAVHMEVDDHHHEDVAGSVAHRAHGGGAM
jgi:hypothetical protein